ncbi:MAG: SAM-dependent chlorinase/fluorinase [Bacteroidetes bacterium]|nr:SAM-dependent chlorinase/fluorinase [Bacteroidota bacterium]
MPVITLTSDWGITDHYLGAVKGAILSRHPNAVIVDISHKVDHYDIRQAAFIIRNAFPSFPEGTIHILAIDSIESDEHPHIVVKAKGHYFIGADSGLFSLILDEEPEKIVALRVLQDTGYFTFPARDRFAKVACMLAEGNPIEELGEQIPSLVVKLPLLASIKEDKIEGRVMYIDSYKNVYLNITEKDFRKTVGNKPFTIQLKRTGDSIDTIVKAYGDVPEGEMCALFSSSGYLEIALNRDKASSLLNLHIDDTVSVIIGE